MTHKPDFQFGRPRLCDRKAVAKLLAEDMADLGMPTTVQDLLAVSDILIKSNDEHVFCRVVRPAPEAEPVGIVIANLSVSVKFAGHGLWIEKLYVNKSWRRRRLGRLLVELVLDWAEVNGINGIDLEAYQGNTPAGVLYRSLGFERLSRERYYFSFGWLEQIPDE